MWVVARTRRQFDTDTVGLLLHAARIGAHEGKIADRADDVLPNRGIHAVVRADGSADGGGQTDPHGLSGLFPAMLAQGVGHFVAHHGRQFVVVEFQFLDDAGIDRDLPARHAPGVHFSGSDHIDFPAPAGGIVAENCRWRNQAGGDLANAPYLRRITVEQVFLLRFLEGLLIGLFCRAIDLCRGHHHGLLPVDTDGPAGGGAGGDTAGQQGEGKQGGSKKMQGKFFHGGLDGGQRM